jgi:hypothetical protein
MLILKCLLVCAYSNQFDQTNKNKKKEILDFVFERMCGNCREGQIVERGSIGVKGGN